MHLRLLFAALPLFGTACALANETAANPTEAVLMVARADVLVASDILDLIAEVNKKPQQQPPAVASTTPVTADNMPETSQIASSTEAPAAPPATPPEEPSPQPAAEPAPLSPPPAEPAPSSTAVVKEAPAPLKQVMESLVADPVAPEANQASEQEKTRPPQRDTSQQPAPAKPGTMTTDKATPSSETAPAEATAHSEKLSARFDPDLQQFRRGKLAYWFKQYDKALAEWRPLAEKGMPEAQSTVGWMYQSGHGVEQNHAAALEWYTKSAAQGYVVAQHNLGIFYENGWGVKQDYKAAVQWYEKAAAQGFGYAYYNLGLLSLNGKGKKKDKKEAERLFKEAYSRNVKQAGAMLESLGVDVPKKTPAHADQRQKTPPHKPAGKDAALPPAASSPPTK